MLEWTFDADFLGIARRDIETNRDEVLVGGDACLIGILIERSRVAAGFVVDGSEDD